MSQRIVRSPSQRGTGQLAVPARIVRALPPDAHFAAELTEEGLLYRYVGRFTATPADVAETPTWAKDGAA